MSTETREFVLDVLRELNYEVDGVTDATPLGDEGLELESLTLAEVTMRLEEKYDVQFTDEELEGLAKVTLGDFVSQIVDRATAGQSR
ncbi:acyl carrier protein [Streptomyces syringium]|uniref:Acyl carrier protein n=1 Tax=Streptomyces syringium TaxID=76729 RepID=A0ABS4Y651_9ACTN|nr:acyl carrier protein [Streptomyces syringium]MBP2404246.1 acyl carrier protein [Streptomyces syringium]SPE53559.1 acyl carrier protein [Streptomyces netropsis]